MSGTPSRQSLGIAILGCGRIAGRHAEAIGRVPDLGRVVVVADPDPARAAALAQAHGVGATARGLDEVLARRDVDAVLVCTPNALHAEQSIRILESGRHVLVEKPFAENAADAERMAECAARTGRVLALGQTLRHTQPIRWLQDHRHDFGRLRAVEVSMLVRWDGPQAPWWKTRTRREGLILSLYAPHALDFVQLVLGTDAQHVHAEVARWQQDWASEDEAMILLRYPGNVLAQVHISYNQRSWSTARPCISTMRCCGSRTASGCGRTGAAWSNRRMQPRAIRTAWAAATSTTTSRRSSASSSPRCAASRIAACCTRKGCG